MKKIGILGGTFSPIHNAHIELAKTALNEYNLDEVWFIVTGVPPHKNLDKEISPFIRYEMTRLATMECEKFLPLDFECHKLSPSYTRDTIREIAESFPDNEFYFIMGEDSLDTFDKWVEPEEIAKYVKFLVGIRSNNKDSFLTKANELSLKYNTEFLPLHCDYIPVSSTELRKRIESGDYSYAKEYINPNVLDFIISHRVYNNQKEYDTDRIIDFIKENQKHSRFMHCISVADTAASLAGYYMFPTHIAYTAGLLHDCAKHLSGEELIEFCENNNLDITEAERVSPLLLHGLVGAHIAKEKFDIDSEMMDAIINHTRGREDMSLLEKIIFLADHIEPGRKRNKKLAAIRIMAYKDIDKAIAMVLLDTIDFLKLKESPIDTLTLKTYEYYK